MGKNKNETTDAPTSYEDQAVTNEGVDTLAQGHGEPPADTAGVTGGADADADANPAFHGGDMATRTEEKAHTAYEPPTE